MTTVKLDRLSVAFGRMFKSYRAAQKRGLLNAAIRGQSWIVTRILPSISPYPPFDTGAFRAGWNFMSTDSGAIIYNPIPHAVFIDQGVRNPRVSAAHLIEWVTRKGIASDAEAPRVAWLIARKINSRGLFLDPQFRITKRVVDEFLVSEVAKQVADELRKVGWKP